MPLLCDAVRRDCQRYIALLLIVGLLVFTYEVAIKDVFDLSLTTDGFPTASAASLIVKEQRGQDPYMTIKMKCFYCDDNDYGEVWQKITNDEKCQVGLFENCFKNRTMQGRHETHVLAFHNYCSIDQCSCNDVMGWCSSMVCNNVKCCLDASRESMIC